jgi:hypothetical protein
MMNFPRGGLEDYLGETAHLHLGGDLASGTEKVLGDRGYLLKVRRADRLEGKPFMKDRDRNDTRLPRDLLEGSLLGGGGALPTPVTRQPLALEASLAARVSSAVYAISS